MRSDGSRRTARSIWAVGVVAFLAAATMPLTAVASADGGCSNQAIREQQDASRLSGCRAYEMVSPPGKGGQSLYVNNGSGEVGGWLFSTAVATDGNAASFQSAGVFGDAQAGNTLNDYVSRRFEDGWRTHSISSKSYPSGTTGANLNVAGWSSNLSRAALVTTDALLDGAPPLAPGATPGQNNIYLDDLAAGAYAPVSLDPGSGPFFPNELIYVGASRDLATVVFEDSVHHTPNTPEATWTNPYAWREGAIELVSILPDSDGSGPLEGEPAPEGAVIGSGENHRFNAVSADGTRIFFSTPDGRLYVREDGSRTKEVSASQKASPEAHQPAVFRTATPDGRFAFFTTAEQLLESDENTIPDLYRFDADTGQLTLVSKGIGGEFGTWYVAGSSDDGAYAYFTVVLGERGEAPAGAGPFEFYVWHNGDLSYVADPGFSPETVTELNESASVRVSANGLGVLFRTDAPQPLAQAPNPGAFQQVYLYDAGHDSLECISCPSGGGAPTGDAYLPRGSSASSVVSQRPAVIQDSISSDGTEAFFSSPDPLVEGDANGTLDAYQFVDGKAHLLSSGQSSSPSLFVNASPSGDDAYFVTAEPLVGADADQNFDLYDARVGGGFSEAPPSVPCSGESCRGSMPATPVGQTAGSALVQDPLRARQVRRAKKRHRAKKQHKKHVRKHGTKRRNRHYEGAGSKGSAK